MVITRTLWEALPHVNLVTSQFQTHTPLCPPHQEPTVGAEHTAPLVQSRGRQEVRREGELLRWRGMERHVQGRAQDVWGLGGHRSSAPSKNTPHGPQRTQGRRIPADVYVTLFMIS